MADEVGLPVAGALARFWAGGEGPSHSSISTAFALAGYDEPPDDEQGNKQARVISAVRNAQADTAQLLVEELLNLLRTAGYFDRADDDPRIRGLKVAVKRSGHRLTSEGYIDWSESSLPDGARRATGTDTADLRAGELEAATQEFVEPTVVPSVSLLVSSLRRLSSALRPVVVKRRQGRRGLDMNDEYDVQDAVEFLLRTLYSDVRSEERGPSSAGASSTMDFLLKEVGVAVEVKVTRQGRGEKNVKKELLVDINDYRQHPSVHTLIAVVYDLADTFDNPAGFEEDLSELREDLEVRVIVVGWSLPRQ